MGQYGLDTQLHMYQAALSGQLQWDWPVGVGQWRRAAKKTLSKSAWGYLEGSAGTESTTRENRRAFERLSIRSQMLRDVSDRDLGVDILGHRGMAPFLLAPIGVQEIIHPDGDLASARAAQGIGVPYVLSTVSSHSMESVAAVMGGATRWFQLYPGRDPDVVKSLVGRAEQAGYSALVVTVDTTMLGWRPRDLQNLYLPFLLGQGIANFVSDPAFCARLKRSPQEDMMAAIQEFLSIYVNPGFTWRDLEALIQGTPLPVLVKGLTHPDDAKRAQDIGAQGVIVSNHGGRQVDGGIGAIDALPRVLQAVRDDFPVLMDSGIRSAKDILKAMALGAQAVLIGRPYAYALAVGGQAGVVELLNQLLAEVDLQLALSGYAAVGDLRPDYVVRDYT